MVPKAVLGLFASIESGFAVLSWKVHNSAPLDRKQFGKKRPTTVLPRVGLFFYFGGSFRSFHFSHHLLVLIAIALLFLDNEMEKMWT
jgi:hypothetical protein